MTRVYLSYYELANFDELKLFSPTLRTFEFHSQVLHAFSIKKKKKKKKKRLNIDDMTSGTPSVFSVVRGVIV